MHVLLPSLRRSWSHKQIFDLSTNKMTRSQNHITGLMNPLAKIISIMRASVVLVMIAHEVTNSNTRCLLGKTLAGHTLEPGAMG
jgi:hypothetical protein